MAPTTVVTTTSEHTMVNPHLGPPSDPYDDEESGKGWWIALAVLLVLLLAAAGAFYVLRHRAPATLTVPAVAGQPAAAAEAQLARTGFTDVQRSTERSNTVGAGDVIGTRPPAGSRAKSDAAIDLLVSGGPVLVPVPDVKGQPQQAATATLRAAGFKVTSTTTNSTTVGQGLVIRTNPSARAQVAQGSSVQLVVSSGKPTVAIPSLIGQDPATAGAILGNLGLATRQLTEASTSVTTGLVTRTSPPAGAKVAVGSTVTVYVSTGVPQVTVPSLVGDTQSQAQAALAAVGLTGQFSSVPVASQSQDGIVQSQNPAPGTSADNGSAVQVVLGSYTAPTTTTTAPTTTTTTLPTTTTTAPTTSSTATPQNASAKGRP